MDASGEPKPNSAKTMSREQVLLRMNQYVELLRQYPGQCEMYKQTISAIEGFIPSYHIEAVDHLQTLDELHRGAVEGTGMKHERTCPLAGPDDFPARSDM